MDNSQRLDQLWRKGSRCQIITKDYGFAFGQLTIPGPPKQWRIMRFNFNATDIERIEQDKDTNIWIIYLKGKAKLYL